MSPDGGVAGVEGVAGLVGVVGVVGVVGAEGFEGGVVGVTGGVDLEHDIYNAAKNNIHASFFIGPCLLLFYNLK